MSSLLVFTRTAGYRHQSIPAGIAALSELGDGHGLAVTATEDVDTFTADGLNSYAAVVFLNTSGDVFEERHRGAFEAYIRGGGAFVGVHCAADTETAWPFYADLVGARFAGHPQIQAATLTVVDAHHPATARLDAHWARVDEWYNFDRQPAGTARTLLTVDESDYEGGTMGGEHPIAWCYEAEPGRGRSFYTALGHSVECYAEPAIRAHLLGAILWTAKRGPTNGGASAGR